jgi:putative tryptophan/tyrosine transport system substrate-binding protein
MRRREFVTLLGAAVAWPLRARAQHHSVIGLLSSPPIESMGQQIAAFRRGLEERGYVEGRNVWIEYRGAPEYERLPAFARELADRKVAVIVATGSALSAHAAKAATSEVPVIFANGSDPVQAGLVESLSRPGSNATGVTFYTSALGPKRLELLRELVGAGGKFGFLVNPTNPVTEADTNALNLAARNIGQNILVVSASTERDIDAAFTKLGRQGVRALIVNVDAFFTSRRHQIIALAARHSIPASYNNREYTLAGGLMSYGDDRLESYRQLGIYAGRVLDGENPFNLPVLQPIKFELVINLRTANALGLTIPDALLARADEVIE